MNKYLKIVLFGALVWVVPYMIGMGLFPTGMLTNDPMLFQTIMSVSAGITSAIATCYYFKGEKKVDVKTGWTITILWLIVLWILDFAFLMPFGMYTIDRYFLEVGLEYIAYVLIPLVVVYATKK